MPATEIQPRALELANQFAAALKALAGVCVIAPDYPAGVTAVVEALKQKGVTEAVGWDDPVLVQTGLPAALAVAGITWLPASPGVDGEAYRAVAARAGVGITSAQYAVAETGTLALMSDPGRPRCASLFPPFHVAIVPVDRLLGNTSDLFRQLAGLAGSGGIPTSLNFVTGPSRTADIEHILVRKVHGPGEIMVVFVP